MTEPLKLDQPSRPADLGGLELLRWSWRQLTSMRTALVLLLLLALAAVPGSVIPQKNIDTAKVARWQDAHPALTPWYERFGLFDVYSSPWFGAIYVLLTISLVGCIVPRLAVYWRGFRAQPPAAPRNLNRLPGYVELQTTASPEEALAAASRVLAGKRWGMRRYRVVSRPLRDASLLGSSGQVVPRTSTSEEEAVSAESGHLREAGNLLFHLAILVVLAGFATGGLFGYQGGTITLVGKSFSNTLNSYDDFAPGSLFKPEWMEPFCFDITSFKADWEVAGRGITARKFVSHLEYAADCRGDAANVKRTAYDLRVNHPLTIGGTDIFLIGHGYAPVVTIRDGDGNLVYGGPTIFLPADQTFQSFGVIKAADSPTGQIGLEGEFYPTFAFDSKTGMPSSLVGKPLDPLVSLFVYTGDLGLDDGKPQSVYVLDKDKLTQLKKDTGQPLRLDLRLGESATLPDGLGTVSFEGLESWNKIQISRSPGKGVALAGVILALIGMCGSLFIRPRRVWVKARPLSDHDHDPDGDSPHESSGSTIVEIGGLDRSGNADIVETLNDIKAQIARELEATP